MKRASLLVLFLFFIKNDGKIKKPHNGAVQEKISGFVIFFNCFKKCLYLGLLVSVETKSFSQSVQIKEVYRCIPFRFACSQMTHSSPICFFAISIPNYSTSIHLVCPILYYCIQPFENSILNSVYKLLYDLNLIWLYVYYVILLLHINFNKSCSITLNGYLVK